MNGSRGSAIPPPLLVGARVYANAANNTTGGQFTPKTFDLVLWDSHGFFHPSFSDRLIVPPGGAGLYTVTGYMAMSADDADQAYASLTRNGIELCRADMARYFTQAFFPPLTAMVEAAPGDYFQVRGYIDDGAAHGMAAGGWLAAQLVRRR